VQDAGLFVEVVPLQAEHLAEAKSQSCPSRPRARGVLGGEEVDEDEPRVAGVLGVPGLLEQEARTAHSGMGKAP
jgi:hypothetical protein